MEYSVKIPKRERLIEALQNFDDAWQELGDVWLIEWEGDLAVEEYPFEKSFDDYNISEWVESAIADVETFEVEEEKDVPVLYYTIKNKIGWSRWCDITGGNHYAINEGYSPDLKDVFYCTKSQAEKLGI